MLSAVLWALCVSCLSLAVPPGRLQVTQGRSRPGLAFLLRLQQVEAAPGCPAAGWACPLGPPWGCGRAFPAQAFPPGRLTPLWAACSCPRQSLSLLCGATCCPVRSPSSPEAQSDEATGPQQPPCSLCRGRRWLRGDSPDRPPPGPCTGPSGLSPPGPRIGALGVLLSLNLPVKGRIWRPSAAFLAN